MLVHTRLVIFVLPFVELLVKITFLNLMKRLRQFMATGEMPESKTAQTLIDSLIKVSILRAYS